MIASSLAYKIAQAREQSPQFGPNTNPEVRPGRVLHLDGDFLAYYAAGNDEMEPGRARHNAMQRIDTLRMMSGSESVVVHLSASGCSKAHRYLIATVKPYQGQRSGRKPKNWAYLREVLEHYEGPRFRPKVWVTREADDGIAYCADVAAKKDTTGEYLCAIATRDKDMRMLPGLHINWMTYVLTAVPRGAYDVVGTDELQYGRKWFYLQLLQGDTADNIPGIPKLFGKSCGEAGASKYLGGTESREEAYTLIQAAYAHHYGEAWPDALVEQAGLLWLRTDPQASIANIAEAFPVCKHISGAIERLQSRVEKGLKDLAEFSQTQG